MQKKSDDFCYDEEDFLEEKCRVSFNYICLLN